MTAAPIVLVPGFWLGAWAWDDVVAALRADGHDVTAITLPGLESPDADRSEITLSDHAFRERAVPEPGAALRETPRLADERRLDVPSTVVCASMSSDRIKAAVEAGHPWVGELAGLRDVSYVDLPTGHWPMWSRARELAVILGGVARRSPRRLGGGHALREVPDLLLAGFHPSRVARFPWPALEPVD